MDESNVTHESKKCCGAVGEGIDRLSLYIRVRDEYVPNYYTLPFRGCSWKICDERSVKPVGDTAVSITRTSAVRT